MDLLFMIKLFYLGKKLISHDNWSRKELEAYQARSADELRSFAYAKSPFYQRFHKGLFNGPLDQLPILTKKVLMENFDDVVTERKLKLADLYSHINQMSDSQGYLGKFRVTSTSGSTGLKGIFPFNDDEWAIASASYLRASHWAGVDAGLTKRLKVAVLGSTAPWHVSAGVGSSLNSWWVPTVSLDTASPLDENVKKLNAFNPHCLMGYPSAIRMLAEQQIEGHLHIFPAAVFCTSEVLTDESRERIYQAFGINPFNVYASTETAAFASECYRHRGMHLYEDLVITEVVDDNNRPVANGEYGRKVLVTVLSSRTVPLIRYEMSDSLKVEEGTCGCDLPFRTIGDIQGRKEEILIYPDSQGNKIKLEPNLFHRIMELVPVAGWQVIQDTENSLRILLCQPRTEYLEKPFIEKLKAELVREKVNPDIFVDYVETLQLTETGKTLLIKSLVNKK